MLDGKADVTVETSAVKDLHLRVASDKTGIIAEALFVWQEAATEVCTTFLVEGYSAPGADSVRHTR